MSHPLDANASKIVFRLVMNLGICLCYFNYNNNTIHYNNSFLTILSNSLGDPMVTSGALKGQFRLI